MTTSRNVFVDLCKVVFTIYVFVMHGEYLFRDISHGRLFMGGYIGVEFFFLVSGFYIAKEENKLVGTMDYCKRRFINLYPEYILSTVILFFITLVTSGFNKHVVLSMGVSLCGLQNIVPYKEIVLFNGPVWYVTYLFYLGIFIFIFLRLTRNFGEEKKKAISFLLGIVSLAIILYVAYRGGNLDNESYAICFGTDGGIIRAGADMVLGVVCFIVYKEGNNIVLQKKAKTMLFLLLGLGVMISFVKPKSYYDVVCVAVFWAIILISNKCIWRVDINFAKYTYGVYCYQVFGFWLLGKLTGEKTSIIVLITTIYIIGIVMVKIRRTMEKIILAKFQ